MGKFLKLTYDPKQRIVVKKQGYPTANEARQKVNEEAAMHLAVSQKGCSYILDCFGTALRDRPEAPYLGFIYMDYAPYSDLYNLIENYRTYCLPHTRMFFSIQTTDQRTAMESQHQSQKPSSGSCSVVLPRPCTFLPLARSSGIEIHRNPKQTRILRNQAIRLGRN